jgi:glycosyltransferase involved in cell wall biosynthesis
MKHITIGWEGLPPYAIAALNVASKMLQDPFVVLSPDVRRPGIDDDAATRLKIVHVDKNQRAPSWKGLKLQPPEIFIHTGWAYPHWNALGAEVRKAGGKLVIMVDNCEKNTLRQFIGAAYFRIALKHRYAAAWVPGSSARRLVRRLGIPEGVIFQGLYGANTAIFKGGSELSARPKTILFSGQLIHRKGIDLLLRAWGSMHQQASGWRLLISGAGEYVSQLKSAPSVEYLGFLSPDQLAEAMRSSRFLILPSREEHWGLVVHEAACSGCGLLLSDAVGSLEDLLTVNGRSFSSNSVDEIAKSLLWATQQSDTSLINIGLSSRRNALAFGSEVCGRTLAQIIEVCR